MARGKRGPALFEVIRNAQKKEEEQRERAKRQQEATELKARTVRGPSAASELLSSVTYWAKGKLAHEQTKLADAASVDALPADTAAEPVKPSPKPSVVFREVPVVPAVAAQGMADDDEPSTPRVIKPAAPAPVAVPAPAPMYESPAMIAARQVREELSAQEAPAAEPFFATGSTAFDAIDDDDHSATAGRDPSAPFNYVTAAVVAFAVMLTFGGAYLIGGRGDKPQVAQSETRPEVLDVRRPDAAKTTPPVDATPTPAPKPPVVDDGMASIVKPNDPMQLETLGRPIPVPTNVRRDAGLHYIVLQSYPLAGDAKELVEYMAQHGVPVTAETALPGYAKSWTSVVTTRGFDRVRDNPAYDRYNTALKPLLGQYIGDAKFSKSFRMQAYKWRTAAK